MPQSTNSQRKKKFAIIPLLLGAGIAAILLVVGGFAFAASQESHDPFCASCHTQPESTFFERSTAAQPADLASYHTTQRTACIDCHSGQGISGRVQAELMGARNALKWYTGTAVQPAVLTFAIGQQNCLKCHETITTRGYTAKQQITVPGGREGRGGRGDDDEAGGNHWHEFLARWQAKSASAGTCTSCHDGHGAGSDAQTGFMNAQNVQASCDACHRVLRREEGG
jgi:nitrate/TMAO reductase-like tetraheme cytochrome c subunit